MPDYPVKISSARAALLPNEFWILLLKLSNAEAEMPQVRITGKQFPDYVSPNTRTRDAFNAGLDFLAQAGTITVRWERNASRFARSVQLLARREELRGLIKEHRPELLPIEKEENNIPLAPIQEALQKYGPLGLRTISHLALGDSHRLDNVDVRKLGFDQIWVQPDVGVRGESVVRAAGRLSFSTNHSIYQDCWRLPGYVFWKWEIDSMKVDTLCVGSSLLLIENPYPYWELLKRWEGKDISLICLHGETRHGSNTESEAALQSLLAKIYSRYPLLKTGIWCDPDPGGLAIASHAYNLAKNLGGSPYFINMDRSVLRRIEELSSSSLPLQSLVTEDHETLMKGDFNAQLEGLRKEITSRNQKGEQEGLVVTFNTKPSRF